MPETYRVRTDGATIALFAGATLIQTVNAAPLAVRLKYDGVRVRVLNDGEEIMSVAAAPNQKLYPKVVPYSVGVTIYNIAFGPAGLQPDVNSNVVDTGAGPGITPVPRTDIITPLGTAAATDATNERVDFIKAQQAGGAP